MIDWSRLLPPGPFALVELLLRLVAPLCGVLIFSAIALNFTRAQESGRIARERRSFVATGSMIGFFVGVYLLIHLKLGVIATLSPNLRLMLMALGALIMLLGTGVNLLGRMRLGRNWANQATVYEAQTLVTSGVYRLVRHPLYASLIWIFYGAGLLYLNTAVLLANTLIFLPGMYYRAALEEKLLSERFPAYDSYQRHVGALFPRLVRKI